MIANIANSPRLQRVAALLSDRLPHSTLEIIYGAHVCAVNTCVHELRGNGYDIDCRIRDKVFYYTMLGSPKDHESPLARMEAKAA